MSKVRVNCFSMSLDGYGAGAAQSTKDPLGKLGEDLHPWLVTTRTFKSLYGDSSEGRTGIDDDFARRGTEIRVGGGVETLATHLSFRRE